MKSKALYEEIEIFTNIYKEIFDIVRVIDPLSKKLIKCVGHEDGDFCYTFWSRDEKCENCITEIVQQDNRTSVKIQSNGKKMYLIIAALISIHNTDVIFELLKEITNNLSFVAFDGGSEAETTILDINDVLLLDSLTKVYNRRYINQVLPNDIEKSLKRDEYLTVVMVDIDDFKMINDTYGHNTGDLVLKKFSKVLKSFIRKDKDWVARFGGDEFLICIHNVSDKEAIQVVNRMRTAIEKMRIPVNSEVIKITGSFGMCTVLNTEITANELIRNADKKLYEAKKMGKNRVTSCLLKNEK